MQERDNLIKQLATKLDKYTDTLAELSNTYDKLETELQRNTDTQSAHWMVTPPPAPASNQRDPSPGESWTGSQPEGAV